MGMKKECSCGYWNKEQEECLYNGSGCAKDEQKPTMTVARTRYWADLLTACRGDYRGLVEEIAKEAGAEVKE